MPVGSKVWLSTEHLRCNRPSKKLDARFIGPFEVVQQINPVAYRLQLPRSLRIHPVFHRSLLQPANTSRPAPDPPAPLQVEGEEEFLVRQIVDSRRHRGTLQYLMDWEGYSPDDRSWEPASDVHAPDLVADFHHRYPDRLGPDLPEGDPGGGMVSCPVPLIRHLTSPCGQQRSQKQQRTRLVLSRDHLCPLHKSSLAPAGNTWSRLQPEYPARRSLQRRIG